MKRLAEAGRINTSQLSSSDKLKAFGKRWFERACIYRLTCRPIFIFSTRRSGSTLLMYAIHSQPGVDYVDEPLNMWRLHPHYRRLPHPPGGMFVELSQDDEAKLARYVEDLLSGRVRFRHRGNLFDRQRTFVVRQLVVKNVNATPLLPWFRDRFPADVIYLIRHPLAVATSLKRRGWGTTAQTYLENQAFCERNLEPGTVDFAWDILDHGSQFQAHVLEWCLDNLHPLRDCEDDDRVLILSYEELVLRADEISSLLASRFNLPFPEQISQALSVPSRTTTEASRKQLEAAGAQSLVQSWIPRVDDDDLVGAQEVLDHFGIEAYHARRALPANSMWHFGPPDLDQLHPAGEVA